MPYHAQPRLDGTMPPLVLTISATIDAGSIGRLRLTVAPPLSLDRLSDETYSNLAPAEALDVIAASLDLAGADWEDR